MKVMSDLNHFPEAPIVWKKLEFAGKLQMLVIMFSRWDDLGHRHRHKRAFYWERLNFEILKFKNKGLHNKLTLINLNGYIDF